MALPSPFFSSQLCKLLLQPQNSYSIELPGPFLGKGMIGTPA